MSHNVLNFSPRMNGLIYTSEMDSMYFYGTIEAMEEALESPHLMYFLILKSLN